MSSQVPGFVDLCGSRRQLRGMCSQLSPLSLGMLAAAALTLLAAESHADARALTSLTEVHEACESTRERMRPALYEIEVDAGWRLGRQHDDHVAVDTRRNLRALEERVSVLLSGLEPVAFEASRPEAAAMREAQEAGARLRLGFFLGFDDPGRQPCLVRGAHSVTIVRIDLAYAELVSSADESIARAETDRLRAWNDDGTGTIEGTGPRGAITDARFSNGQEAPENWRTGLATRAALRTIGRCHRDGLTRGASIEGQVSVRLNVETRTGRVRRADVALSSLGDSEEAECIARAIGSVGRLGAGPSEWTAEVVDLSVSVRVVSE